MFLVTLKDTSGSYDTYYENITNLCVCENEPSKKDLLKILKNNLSLFPDNFNILAFLIANYIEQTSDDWELKTSVFDNLCEKVRYEYDNARVYSLTVTEIECVKN